MVVWWFDVCGCVGGAWRISRFDPLVLEKSRRKRCFTDMPKMLAFWQRARVAHPRCFITLCLATLLFVPVFYLCGAPASSGMREQYPSWPDSTSFPRLLPVPPPSGTVLKAAQYFDDSTPIPPTLAFGLGSLGFLAPFNPSQCQSMITRCLCGYLMQREYCCLTPQLL